MKQKLYYLDLFAGAGGLSEGFIRAGFKPIAHVESDQAACYTLSTRMAYHWLKERGSLDIYADYLNQSINRCEFYNYIPQEIINSVINIEIKSTTLSNIFRRIDYFLGNRKLNLIIGGPPCQAYSVVGRARDKNRMQGDERNYLFLYYAAFLKRYQPTFFVFENVMGLLSARDEYGKLYIDSMRKLFYKYGYETEFKVLSAEDYGILQNRKRIILVGRKGKRTGFYPEPVQWNPCVKVQEVFKDLPQINAGGGITGPCKIKSYYGKWHTEAGIKNEDDLPVTLHQARPNNEQDLEIYRIAVDLWNKKHVRLEYSTLPNRLKTHHNRDSFNDRFKVVAADLPFSHTIVAHIEKDGHYYIHPDLKQNRSISPREAARLQSFPDDYYFESNTGLPRRSPAFRQIGNAVPVLLAEKIAKKLRETW